MLGLIVFAVVAIVVFFAPDAHRWYFGHSSGNLLLVAEIALAAFVLGALSLWRRGKRYLGVAIVLWGASLSFAFLGWFIHPNEVISRAEERLSDWERAIDEYRIEQAYGEKDADASIRFQRLATELAARQSESQAALIRHRGDPEFFRSGVPTGFLWLLSGGCAIAGTVVYRKRAGQSAES